MKNYTLFIYLKKNNTIFVNLLSLFRDLLKLLNNRMELLSYVSMY